jgi:hypothetical protein
MSFKLVVSSLPGTLAIIVLLLGASLLLAPVYAGAPQKGGDGEVRETPSALEAQGASLIKGGWWLSRAIQRNIWKDLQPDKIPLLVVGKPSSAAPFAMLVNHPAPPKDYEIYSEADEEGPAVFISRKIPGDPAGHGPILVAGKRTAYFIMGESLPPGELGAQPGEQQLSRLVHELVHTYLAMKGQDIDPGRPPAGKGPLRAEVLALAGVENKILAQFLYTDRENTAVLEELASQFLAVRRARWALMGDEAEYEKKVELKESAPHFTEIELVRLMGSRVMEPPPSQDSDPTYESFKYALVQRVNLLLSRLLQTPSTREHLQRRAFITGGALAVMLDRMGVQWREMVHKPDVSLTGLIAARLDLTPGARADALAVARERYGYRVFLALASEHKEK